MKGQYDQWIVALGATNGFWQGTRGNELQRQEVVVRQWDASNLDYGLQILVRTCLGV